MGERQFEHLVVRVLLPIGALLHEDDHLFMNPLIAPLLQLAPLLARFALGMRRHSSRQRLVGRGEYIDEAHWRRMLLSVTGVASHHMIHVEQRD